MSQTDAQPIDVAIELPLDLLRTLRLTRGIGETGFSRCRDRWAEPSPGPPARHLRVLKQPPGDGPSRRFRVGLVRP